MNETFLNHLDWRFATKQFDPDKKLSEADLDRILTAAQMSPSSFGIQPYHIHVITEDSLRSELRKHSWNQPQVTDCSHYLVFSARTDLNDRIEEYFKLRTGGDAEKRKALEGYESMMRGFAENRSAEWVENWAGKQAYIALGFAMAACAELSIDACPMEGFDHDAVHKSLDLPDHIRPAVCLAIGYRAEGPAWDKVRFPKDELFTMKVPSNS